MGSYSYGKEEVVNYIKSVFPKGSTCLDVGACDGKYFDLLGDYLKMDGVEIFQPNIDNHRLREKYNKVFCCDIADFIYDYYDLIIFGDVIEHMKVEKAQKVLRYAYPRCKDMIIAVPWLYTQGEIYGNPYEKHIQNDLTLEVFRKRYGEFTPIFINNEYAYFRKGKND